MDEQNNIQEESLTQNNNINSVESQSFSKEHTLEAGFNNSGNAEADLIGNKTNEEAAINSHNAANKETYYNGNNISNKEAVFNANNAANREAYLNGGIARRNVANPQAYSAIGNQFQNNQISTLERQMLLNYNNPLNITSLSNWTKVMLTAVVVLIPGIGQIVGIILGLVFIANDRDADRRSYGAALITVSVIAFIISAIFWFMFAMSFGPELYYY
jgi:hypothetical protein